MYANIENPPASKATNQVSSFDPTTHEGKVQQLADILYMIKSAKRNFNNNKKLLDNMPPSGYVFYTQPELAKQVQKWSYITYRLERYYLKKVCELNSMAYKAITK